MFGTRLPYILAATLIWQQVDPEGFAAEQARIAAEQEAAAKKRQAEWEAGRPAREAAAARRAAEKKAEGRRADHWLRAKQTLKDALNDPGSADFSNVIKVKHKTGLPYLCGWLSAKNAFGGRVKQPWVYLAGHVDIGRTSYNKMCAGKSGHRIMVW